MCYAEHINFWFSHVTELIFHTKVIHWMSYRTKFDKILFDNFGDMKIFPFKYCC